MTDCPVTKEKCRMFDNEYHTAVNDRIDKRVFRGLDKRIAWQLSAMAALLAVVAFFYSSAHAKMETNMTEVIKSLRSMSVNLAELKYIRKDVEYNRNNIQRLEDAK